MEKRHPYNGCHDIYNNIINELIKMYLIIKDIWKFVNKLFIRKTVKN